MIPAHCKCCGRPLMLSDVERFGELCEATGRDPMVHGSKGIKCAACLVGAIMASPEYAAAGLVAKCVEEDIPEHLRARMVAGGAA